MNSDKLSYVTYFISDAMTFATESSSFPSGRSSRSGEPPWDVALLFPLQGSWTEHDYLELSTNHLVELSDGCIEVLPMPTKLHQRIVRFLFLSLQQFISANATGEVFFAPLPIRLWPGKFREPDIVYVRPERGEYRGQPEGADLAIEVVSEGEANRRRDLEIKRLDYAKANIPEYWIVDPEKKEITVLVLDGETYRPHGIFGVDDTATSVSLSGFTVPVRDVFGAARENNN
jgi:Uma2 family endonuclease